MVKEKDNVAKVARIVKAVERMDFDMTSMAGEGSCGGGWRQNEKVHDHRCRQAQNHNNLIGHTSRVR